MARKLSEASSETQAAAGVRNNMPGDVTPEVFDRNLSAILRNRYGPLALAEAAFKAAKKVEKGLYAAAKVDGLRIDVLKRTITKRDLDRVDPGKGQEIVILEQKYDALAGLAPGEQAAFDFDKIPDGDEKDKVRWHNRGFEDIRFGATDPEGYTDPATGEKSVGPIMPNQPPSYVPMARHTDWVAGAAEADAMNNRDFLQKNGQPAPTPLETAAAKPAKAAGKAAAKSGAEVMEEDGDGPASRARTQPGAEREGDLAGAKAEGQA